MDKKEEFDTIREALNKVSKEDIVKLILEKVEQEQVPISVFTTNLSPLGAITRYLKEQGKKINQISRILCKKPASVSHAYKSASSKQFKLKKTDIFIPLSEFHNNLKLSILEVVVSYLRNKNLRFTEIAILLERDPKTVWTVYQRAKKKRKNES